MRLWSRNGNDFTAKFSDVQVALASQVDADCVLDGELVVGTGNRLDFDALQQRMASTAATVRRRLAPAQPASFVAFDVLAIDSVDVRQMRWTAHRTRLEALTVGWTPPMQLSPATADADEAMEWLEAFKTSGVEGLVVKGDRPHCQAEVRPGGRARQATGTGLGQAPVAQIATHWGKDSRTAIIKVQPKVVVEVAADAALQASHYRHPLRLMRHRADVQPEDVPTLPEISAGS